MINVINSKFSVDTNSLDIFSLDGIIKGTLSVSLVNLVFTYSFRYVMVKVFVLLSPLAILSLSLSSTSWFFKTWIRNLFSMLFIQIIVSLVLVLLFYVGGVYVLIKANSFVREFIGGVSTTVSQNVYKLKH